MLIRKVNIQSTSDTHETSMPPFLPAADCPPISIPIFPGDRPAAAANGLLLMNQDLQKRTQTHMHGEDLADEGLIGVIREDTYVHIANGNTTHFGDLLRA